MEDLTGKQFGHYQIVAPLGEGGMAAVYKAYQPSMERYVAVKVLPRHLANSEEFVARFKREAKLLAQLQHPHILPVFDYGESEGYTYIVMPFIQSGTLADLMRARRLNLVEIRRVMTQIGDALAYAHTRGMIHRDIKPSNVLIDERGNCLLTDFGLARMTEATSAKLTSSGAIMGTPAYMSPEQGAGNPIDGRSDIYSLGIILYEMVTGRVPYSAETPIAIVFKHITDPLPSALKLNPDLPEAVELVLLKALAKNPEDRYQKAEDFVRALQMAIPETTVPLGSMKMPSNAAISQPATSVQVNQATFTEPPGPLPVVPVSQPQPPVSVPLPISVAPARPRSAPPKWIWAALAGLVVLIIVGVVGVSLAGNLFGAATDNATPTLEHSNGSGVLTQKPPLEIITANVFKDEFNQQISSEWSWAEEDPTKWMLANGALQIVASSGSLDSANPPTNVLNRYAPEGDFEITTRVHFAPTNNFQFAGLIIFQDSSNAVQLGRAFCDSKDNCIGSGVYFDSIQNSTYTQQPFKQAYMGEDTFLRLVRVANLYTGYYSTDGANWIKVGEYKRDFSGANVGLIADQAQTEITATFDEFTLREPPSIKANGDFNCFDAPSAGAKIVTTFGTDATAQLRSTSVDGNWLYIQNPDDRNQSCWLYFKAASLNLGAGADLVTRVDTTPTPTPPTPPTAAVPTDREFVVITAIEVNEQGKYVVSYETYQYTEKLPGMHVHFFFNTVPFDQAGKPGKGPWLLYGGPRPFTGYKTSDRPKDASQLCALVANANHSVKPESGTCFPLPDVVSATARVDTVCRTRLSADVGTTNIPAGTTSLLLAIGQAQDWIRIQNPQDLEAACWAKFGDMQINGDASGLPVVDPMAEPTPTRAPTGATVTGKVIWGGAPVPGAMVQLKETGNYYQLPVLVETTTDAQGNFTITDAPTGNLYIYAVPPPGSDFGGWRGQSITTARGTRSRAIVLTLTKTMQALEPANQSSLQNGTPTFVWKPFPAAAKYHIDVFNNKTGEAIFRKDTTATNLVSPVTLPAGEYQWTVIAYDATGNEIAFSIVFIFTVQP